MALTLSKIMARAWREIGHGIDLQATGGSTTTIVVNSTENPYASDDQLNGGTALVTRDAGGAGAAPEGEFAVISDYVASTKTWTVGTLTTAPASGDAVLMVSPKIKLTQMKQAVNDGLSNLGTISLIDTSLSTISGQTEYALPVGLKIKRLHDVLIQQSTDASDGYYESVRGHIRDFPAAPASTGLLQFTSELSAGYVIKLVYEGVHPTLSAFSDVVSETIQEELAVAAAIDKALTWYVSKRRKTDFNAQRWNDAKQTLQLQKYDKPVNRSQSRPKFFMSGM